MDSFLLSEMRHWTSPSSSLPWLIYSMVACAGEDYVCHDSWLFHKLPLFESLKQLDFYGKHMRFPNYLRILLFPFPRRGSRGPQRVKLTSSTSHSWSTTAIEFQIFASLTSKSASSSSRQATVSPSCPRIFTGESGDLDNCGKLGKGGQVAGDGDAHRIWSYSPTCDKVRIW